MSVGRSICVSGHEHAHARHLFSRGWHHLKSCSMRMDVTRGVRVDFKCDVVICLQQRVSPVKCRHVWMRRFEFATCDARGQLLYYAAMQLASSFKRLAGEWTGGQGNVSSCQ